MTIQKKVLSQFLGDKPYCPLLAQRLAHQLSIVADGASPLSKFHDDDDKPSTPCARTRLLSSRQRLEGPRSASSGRRYSSSLVDYRTIRPLREDIRQLHSAASSPTGTCRCCCPAPRPPGCLTAPAGEPNRNAARRHRPVQRIARGDIGWALISVLTQNYLSIAGAPNTTFDPSFSAVGRVDPPNPNVTSTVDLSSTPG